MSKEMSTTKYWNDIYRGTSKAQPGGHEGDRFSEVMRRFKPGPEMILDAAAGYATLAKRIRSTYPEKTVEALDFSMEAKLRSAFTPYYLRDAEQMDFDAKSFDTIICCQGMGYMESPDKFAVEAGRVGKRLILTVSNGLPAAGVRWEFTEASLRDLFSHGTFTELYLSNPAMWFGVVTF